MSRIDVVVTCYNYGRFLRQCAHSVLTQSHRDLRLLIIDDASTDGTAAICADLSAQDPRVEIHRHPVNIGHIATYNEGIALAQGDYLLLLSADDFLLSGALARAVAVLDRAPEVGLVHGAWLLYRSGDVVEGTPIGDGTATILDSAAFIEGLSRANTVATATAIVRTSVQKTLGGYRPDLPHAGDLEMWLRYALHSRVAYINALQAAYRRHDSNMSLGYRGVADPQQCKRAFLLHIDEIRTALPDGPALADTIRKRLVAKSAHLALAALRDRRFVDVSALVTYSLYNAMIYLLRKPLLRRF